MRGLVPLDGSQRLRSIEVLSTRSFLNDSEGRSQFDLLELFHVEQLKDLHNRNCERSARPNALRRHTMVLVRNESWDLDPASTKREGC